MTRGVLMYAHNNAEIDYFRIACANALMVKRNLGVPVTIVTDTGTLAWGKQSLGEDTVNNCFDNVICVNIDTEFKNPRNFSDTSHYSKNLTFYNCNHWQAYNLSPYDETLFIDADYLVMSDQLNNCWGSNHDFMINHKIYSTQLDSLPYTKYIDDFGITLYWATVIYFKKTDFSEFVFSMVRHVQENYRYYKDLYCLSNGMFRNDNAFSIAIHTLNGFRDSENSVVGQLPIPGLLMSWDTDDIHSVPGENDVILYSEKKTADKGYLLTRLKNTDVHIMNKWAINRFSEKLIDLYKKANND